MNHNDDPQPVDVSVLLPHEVMAAFYNRSPATFQTLFAGDMSQDGIGEFWQHVKKQANWKDHPVLNSCSASELGQMIPVNIHADGAEFYRDDEYFVYSWSSAFPTSITDVLISRIPIAIVPERQMLDVSVKDHVNTKIAQLTAWSLTHASAGLAPLQGFSGEAFEKGSYRETMAGQQLAQGWRLGV